VNKDSLLFQVLDQKRDCIGYFANNSINPTQHMPASGATWEYSTHLPGDHYELARVYSAGATLTEVCPEDLRDSWEEVKKQLRACLKAFKTSQLSLDENCFYDVVPEYFLYRYLQSKNNITQHVLDTYPKPANYQFMYNLVEMLASIREQPLSLNISSINHLLGSVRGKNFHRSLQTLKRVCDYNPWGTVTGRLATQPNTFPILTMNKEFRRCLEPQNDWFLELDFNAAELRTLLALAGVEQPKNDIHDWNVKNIFDKKLTRDEAKVKTFAWLYSNKKNKDLERLYNKDLVRNKYWDGCKIETDYGRIIENVDEHHALNYIVQSTTIDMVHEQAYKVYELLKGRKSRIAFLIHDAVYIDLAEEDRYDLLNLLDTFRKTRYDMFKVNVSAGKNLGEMKELRL
tara:strand:+ start:470 stop:1672 length:1203 start_codon:yes stop_codon:yes gene_type:complete